MAKRKILDKKDYKKKINSLIFKNGQVKPVHPEKKYLKHIEKKHFKVPKPPKAPKPKDFFDFDKCKPLSISKFKLPK